MKTWFLLGIIHLLAGCTTNLVVNRATDDPKTRIGMPHPLLVSQYTVALSHQIIKCSDPILVKITSEVQPPKTIPDMENLFIINPATLSGPLKTSSVNVEYHPSGSPLALNAKAEDRTAQVIVGIASLGVSLAGLSAVPQVQAPGAQAADKSRCTDETVKSLTNLSDESDKVKAFTLTLDQAVATLKSNTEKVAQMGANVDDRTKHALSAALDNVSIQRKAHTKASEKLNKTLEVLTFENKFVWPKGAYDREHLTALPEPVLKRWIRDEVNDGDRQAGIVHLTLSGATASSSARIEIDEQLGIPIQIPAMGSLLICSGNACLNGGQPIGTPRDDKLVQLGGVVYLPCKSRPFSSVECSYSTTEDGHIKSMGTKDFKASLEEASGATKSVIDSLNERRRIQGEGNLKRIEAETALQKARAESAAADQIVLADVSATAAARARADLYNAKRAEKEAELALAEVMLQGTGQ